MTRSICRIDDCEGIVKGQGLCNLHYTRLRRNGDPEKLQHFEYSAGAPDEERLWQRIEITESGCWKWLAGGDERGMPYFRLNSGRGVRVARWLYELEHGVQGRRVWISRVCGTEGCVNPGCQYKYVSKSRKVASAA